MIRADLDAATPRLWRLMGGVSVVGAIGAAVQGGLPALVGFASGAAFSAVNFWFWHRLVRRIGAPGEGARGGSTAAFALRYLLFGLALYGILHYFEGSLFAALLGCFVAVAAVLLEIAIELIYGT